MLIRESDVVTEDLYASGNSVVIRGRIEGDLVATAFESIVIEGVVEGDVIALTTRLEIAGEVGGSVRGMADQVVISGRVGDDLIVAARTIRSTGSVARDILAFGYRMTTTPDSAVGRDLKVQVLDHVRLAGVFEGDAEVNAGSLVVVDGTTVGGDLRYRAEATIGDVKVDGVSIELGNLPTPIRVKTLLLLGALLGALAVVALTFLMFWVAPTAVRLAADAVAGWRWVLAMVVGLAVLIVPAAIFAGLAAGAAWSSPDFVLIVVVVLSPFVALWLAVLASSLMVGYVPVAIAVGRRLLPRRSVFVHVLAGLLLVAATAFVPVIGPLLTTIAWFTGLGAWFLGAWRARRPGSRTFEAAS